MDNNTDPELITDTGGVELKTRRVWLADAVELLSSMRFAISLLSLIAIASVIGTVLKQNEPMPNYVNQFGPFWFEVFKSLSLYGLYSSWWFLLIMAFLVLSTSLCLIRNTPKMLKDMRSWRENVREQSLRNFRHKDAWRSEHSRTQVLARLTAHLTRVGYRSKIVDKDGASLIAAKQGAANKWGYIFAHSAIVIICVGGMLDSEMPIRFQQWFMGKVPFDGNGIIADIPAKHRLALSNPTFRGNTMIPEGASSNTAIIAQQSGVFIQDLPFTIKLKKFTIDFYSTGMPKLFASDVEILDHASGKSFSSTIEVNHPLIYKGVALYQSSFEDGGSRLKLAAFPMTGTALQATPVRGEVGGSTPFPGQNGQDLTIEWSGFRPFNVENMARNGADVRAVNSGKSFNQQLSTDLQRHLGSAAKNANNKELKNVGASVQYKLRDKTGQAREFNNYMQSMLIDGEYMFLAGTRDSPADAFRYLRIPADDKDSVQEWMRLRAALMQATWRAEAAHRYALRAMSNSTPAAAQLQAQLAESAEKSLAIFAGTGQVAGFVAISQFLEKIPAAEQGKAADVFMKIFNGSLWDLWMVAREHDHLPALELSEKHGRFLQLATAALSDAYFYGAPVYLQLQQYEEIKASVLQVTRSPGKNVVYFGCLLLVLGVFSMFYIRERRLWIWLKDDGEGTQLMMALSSQRKTLDFEKEFAQLRLQLRQLTGSAQP
ncbi:MULTISPECIES: cytochrome c biogenesis protein ResB [unclassified Undibacterium]|uniref:cytochrome c biogenesis protein ResB n=2 Tax=Oxalobacteraceae TaxID=75682 RepID=UPI002AC9C7E2|nr:MULTISPECIES: cytochrome c biogenesis protein ResB [unclassified Undibacterium]MEB0137525.1 cytochrome c biogenesis protein ResB [Undibacterium sp. CCC2.1]MEB0170810.1 cytochrome c biogenesis protein ResB [Undibacterium sp. CCC1.1]MEB0174762.1 cytochrome c biogenesis protein ResB [Undibacterium sp. CCC3.4]MEB0214098.1 cytochrome c biogenesis protein ResB [Undibacterium sp. 5I2]WPX44414.1 cytochrome c biogenesis protein ResB [Undibacterium sp. CCC3.4]